MSPSRAASVDASAPDSAAPPAGGAPDETVDVVESRTPEGFGFFVKARASGQTYRISPARDPRQPRFWCVLVTRCTSAGVADPTERPWIGAGGMTREELPEALAAIRADVGGWLGQEACHELRRWVLSPTAATAAPGSANGAERKHDAAARPAAVGGVDAGTAAGVG